MHFRPELVKLFNKWLHEAYKLFAMRKRSTQKKNKKKTVKLTLRFLDKTSNTKLAYMKNSGLCSRNEM